MRYGWLLICWGLVGCSTLPIPVLPSQTTEAAYTALHPYYFEFCALSEIMKKPGYGADIRGGIGGHSTIYLNGACLQGDGYPELMVCAEHPGSDGVGLSINAHFANANWAAIPGREFFYHGDLKPGQALTRQVYDATKDHAKRLGIYDAIRFHDEVFDDMPKGYERDAYKYEVSIATDYAIGYGRYRYCSRVPVSAAEMQKIVDYLNGLNQPYRDGTREYDWSVFTDNCIHVAHNALATIGFWPVWPTHRPFLISVFDFPVPANEFVNIARRANDMPVRNLLDVWDDASARQALLAGDGLPRRPAAMVTFDPATQDNALYDAELKLIFYDDPVFGSYEGWYRGIVADPRYTDLEFNLESYRVLYQHILEARQPMEAFLAARPALRSQPDFPAFYARYYEAIGHAMTALGPTTSTVAQAGG